ncbi:MAG: hypothetical protein H7201_11090 [Candidatus Saccharibacteria bacterium]|nr:hypothetical protein [Microbacteriaceae bacterium]
MDPGWLLVVIVLLVLFSSISARVTATGAVRCAATVIKKIAADLGALLAAFQMTCFDCRELN